MRNGLTKWKWKCSWCFRTNLELELLQRTDCSPCLPAMSSLVGKKYCIG